MLSEVWPALALAFAILAYIGGGIAIDIWKARR